jgi:8-oxo-dGTP pyrophosphatase MutT (NUDIX family)
VSDEGRFQVAVGAVIRNSSSDKVLLIHRAAEQHDGGIWELPIGRLKQFESLKDGLMREVAEETGITDLKIGRPTRAFAYMRGNHSAANEVRGIVFEAETVQQEVILSDTTTTNGYQSIKPLNW